MLYEKNDSDGHYSRGHYSIGRMILEPTLDKIRKIVEKCDDFQGFKITTNLGGGTGSGFGSLLLHYISLDYDKKAKIGFNVYPSSNMSSSPIEPYNVVLSNH